MPQTHRGATATTDPAATAAPTFVVGYDGSAGAGAAVRWAAAQAAPRGRVVVVHAEHPAIPRPAASAWTSRAKAGLDALWTVEHALGDVTVELEVAEGAPAAALCRAARTADADGIVVGRHRDSAFNADTVRQLLALADRPVTVVPG
ncbi:universal stress protein [Baekduia soli]|nr:universal stress protein [Baekduia soli]